jgi:uncharacterized protein YceH (UPF0502 family)
MAEFDSPAAIQGELEILADQPEPLVRLLGRRPGQKEERWQQLLATETDPSIPTGESGPTPTGHTGVDDAPETSPVDPALDSALGGAGLEHRIGILETELAAVRAELGEVSASLGALRQSLGE